MFYGGESNVPGAVGNVGAYGNTLAGTWMRRDFPQGQQPEADQLFRRGLENTESGKKMQENIQRVRQMLPQAMEGVGNTAGMLAQINPTYPAGSPNYGQPLQVGGKSMSLSTGEYNWMQKMNELERTNPDAYQKIKGMMGPHGWNNPPAGFQVPPGI